MLSLGSSSQLGIGIQILLQDKFSGTAATVARNMKALKNQASESVTSAMRAYRNNAAGIAASAAAASYAMYGMVENAAEFQHRINQVAIVGGTQLGKTRKELSQFAQSMTEVYGKTPTEIASAMFENAKAGITTNMNEITKYQMAVATATEEKLEGAGGVAETLIGIMNAYDINSNKFKDIANAITSVANSTVSSVTGIGHSMQYAAFTAKNFNIPLEMTLAMVGKLSQANITGSAAGTGINNMLLQLAKTLGPLASKKSQKIWGMLGLDRGAMANMMNSGNITGVVQALSSATSAMTPVNRNALLSDLFQRRGDRALEGIFGTKNGISLDQLYRGALGDEKRDIANVQAKKMMDDLSGSIKKLVNAWTVFTQVLVEGVTPGLRVVMGFLTGVVHVLTAIGRTPFGKVIFGLIGVIIPLIGIMFTFRAALMAATIALGGFSATSKLGGFKALLGAGINNLVGNSGGLLAGMKINRAGKPYVGAGSTVNFGGKVYGPGSFLPGAAMGAANAAGSVGTMMTIGAGILRIVGYVSVLITVVSILTSIYEWWKGSSADQQARARHMNSYSTPESSHKFWGDDLPSVRAGNWVPSQAQQNQVLSQTINVNVDGKQAMSQQVDQKMSDDMNNQIDFNTIH